MDVAVPERGTLKQLIRLIWHNATQRVISITFAGMLLSLAVDVLIAAKLGTQQVADALIIALSLPLFVDIVIREGTKFSLVPLFIEKHNTLNKVEWRRFVSGLLNLALVMGLTITSMSWLLAPWIVATLGPGMTEQGKTEAALILRIVAPITFFALGVMVLSVLLNSQQRFTLVALRTAVAPGVVVLTIGLAWRSQQIALWIAAAYLVGFASFFALLWFGARKIGHRHSWRTWLKMGDIRDIWDSASLPIIGFISLQAVRMIERRLATLMAVGSVASYYFAFRIFSAIQTMVGVSIATTSLPALTQHSLSDEKEWMAVVLRQRVLWALAISLPVTVMLTAFHKQIVHWVYERGAFNEVSTQQTSQVLVWLAIGIMFLTMIPVLNSGLYAQRAYRLAFQNMVTIAIVNVVLAWLFSQFWGLIGLATAASLSVALGAGDLIRLLKKTGIPLSIRSGSLDFSDLSHQGRNSEQLD